MSPSLLKFLPPKKNAIANTESDAVFENQTAAGSCGTLASHKLASSTTDISSEVSSEPVSAPQILLLSSGEVHSEPFCNDTIVSHQPAHG